jgi:hypothetical protein
MVWVVDDIAEAALGPWGIAVGVGVGVVSAVWRRKTTAVAPSDTMISPAAVPGGWRFAGPAGAWAAGRLDGARSAADGVKDRVQTVLTGAGAYWHDLYAEAHHEWEQGRAGVASKTAPPAAAPSVGRAMQTPASRGTRVRGPNGRYVRASV